MTTIYLIRHGQVHNPQDLVYLRLDEEIPLSPAGIRQAHHHANRLQHTNISAIYASPLTRTWQTARILASQLHLQPLQSDDRLLEVYNPFIQGLTMTEYKTKWQSTLYHPQLLAHGAESIDQVWHRMQSALLDYASQHPDGRVIAVSHGDPIKITWLGVAGLPFTSTQVNDSHPTLPASYPERGSITIISVDNQKMQISDYWPPPASNNSQP